MVAYEVRYHFDVWGNPRDGFDVNDSRSIGTIKFSDYPTDRQILQALKEMREVAKHVRLNMIDVRDNVGGSIDIDRRATGRPLFTLYEIEVTAPTNHDWSPFYSYKY